MKGVNIMKNILKYWIRSRCEIVVDEDALVDALKVLNDNRISDGLMIKKLDWRESNKWSIDFTASRKQIESIESELKSGKFKEVIMLTNTNSLVKVEKLI